MTLTRRISLQKLYSSSAKGKQPVALVLLPRMLLETKGVSANRWPQAKTQEAPVS